ncbi:metallophosphoesterase [Treponema sp.]|uniref:metallophosphoesterase family protein n=1 Tax=Treponema sp. TaxID=166 RepID=UPI0025802022|nr:metallophosphoesterase [Treponema sp.]MBE6354828.1 serine/threonine protein phosphatase [Treponema sp.]
MKFLVISDLHGNLDVLDRMDEQFKNADAVLFAGDFTKFGAPETGKPALEKLCKKHDVIFSVIGNCDDPEFIGDIEAADISVQKTLVNHEGLCFAGSGGGSKFTGETANERTDEELLSDFNIIIEQGQAEWNNLIAIMHNPPKDTECDKVAPEVHVGSPLLRKFIDDYKPLAVITGHIHESAGITKTESTTIINPGALTDGKYAVLEVEKKEGRWSVTNCQLMSL